MFRIIKAVIKFLYWLYKLIRWIWRRLRPGSRMFIEVREEVSAQRLPPIL